MRRRVPVLLCEWFISCLISAWATLIGTAAEPRPQIGNDLFVESQIPHFKIEIADGELQKLAQNSPSYIHATVTVGEKSFKDVGIRLKGRGSFRPVDQKPSLAVKFNQFVPGQNFYGLTKIMLNNASQDPSLLSEYVATRLFREAGVPAARVTHARVSLNGRDVGFYVLIEAMNAPFLKQHFADPRGCLYEGYARDIDQKLEQDGGAPSDQSDLSALVAVARMSVAERMDSLRKIFDVDRFYSFLAVSTFLAQHDSYQYNRNNYRLYCDPANGRFVMIPHGIDGTFKENALSIRPPSKFILTRAVLETEGGQRRYREIFGTLFTNIFDLQLVTNRVKSATVKLTAGATTDQERAGIFSQESAFLRRVAQRHAHIAYQLAHPDPPHLFIERGQSIRLTGWHSWVDAGQAGLDARKIDGRDVLSINIADVPGLGAWRTRAILSPPGRYRMTGQVQTSTTATSANSSGAGLRAYKMYAVPVRKVTNGIWTDLQHPFIVSPGEEEIEFICDFRASNGEAWFALDSLQVARED